MYRLNCYNHYSSVLWASKNWSNKKWISNFFYLEHNINCFSYYCYHTHTICYVWQFRYALIKLHICTINLFHAIFYKRSSQLNNNVSSIFFIVRLSNSPIIAKKLQTKNRCNYIKTVFAQTKLVIHFINIHYKTYFKYNSCNGLKGSALMYVAKMIYLFPNQNYFIKFLPL